jgi:hypothetical protein
MQSLVRLGCSSTCRILTQRRCTIRKMTMASVFTIIGGGSASIVLSRGVRPIDLMGVIQPCNRAATRSLQMPTPSTLGMLSSKSQLWKANYAISLATHVWCAARKRKLQGWLHSLTICLCSQPNKITQESGVQDRIPRQTQTARFQYCIFESLLSS